MILQDTTNTHKRTIPNEKKYTLGLRINFKDDYIIIIIIIIMMMSFDCSGIW